MANLILDRRCQRAVLNSRELTLDQFEFEVLWVLSAFTGRPMSIRCLLGRLDDLELEADSHTIHTALLRLEHKLGRPQLERLQEGRIVLH